MKKAVQTDENLHGFSDQVVLKKSGKKTERHGTNENEGGCDKNAIGCPLPAAHRMRVACRKCPDLLVNVLHANLLTVGTSDATILSYLYQSDRDNVPTRAGPIGKSFFVNG